MIMLYLLPPRPGTLMLDDPNDLHSMQAEEPAKGAVTAPNFPSELCKTKLM